jgi:pimeloyl-ACP methyl ester carboxylesterase
MSYEGWDVRESGPVDAERTVLLLPGGLCTHVAFEPIIAALAHAPIRVVAATLPGFGRTAHPMDLTIENYAALAEKLAADVGADVVAGHSLGGNVALEMAAGGGFSGPVLLLSPSFSREDEAKELSVMNSIGRVPVIGRLAWIAMLKVMPRAMRSKLPADSADAMVADLANNDARFCRGIVRDYFRYLDRHGSVAARLCESGTKAYVAFGDNDEIGLTDHERRELEACPNVSLITIADATHFMVVEQPARIAELITELAGVRAASASSSPSSS